MAEWPTPTSRKQLQQFLGFATFYPRFFLSELQQGGRAIDQAHLYTLLLEEDAFARLNVLFITAPILCHPDQARQFEMEVDASVTRVGAVLS